MNKIIDNETACKPASRRNSEVGCDCDLLEVKKGRAKGNRESYNSPGLVSLVAILFVLISLVAGGTACSKFSPPSNNSSEVALRLSGSNTIGAKLAPALVEKYLQKIGAKDIETIKGSNAEEMSIRAVLPGETSAKIIEIKAHGSDTGVQALENEDCDIGMLSRKLKSEEVQKLAKVGDLLSPGSENVIAMDGIAIIVNRSNPVRELTLKQIAQVFTGEITNWSDLEGKDGKINVYARDDKSGTFDTFKNLVLGKEKKLIGAAKRFEDSNELSDAVSRDVNGIGFVGLPYINNANALAVYEEGTTPLKPAPATVNRREYLLYRELYFYLPPKNTNKLAKDLIEFAKSDAGQDVAQEVGFVSQKIIPTDPKIVEPPAVTDTPRDVPPELTKIRESYSKAYIVFQFKSGGDELDTKSLDDFNRFVSFLQKQKVKEIVLVGFTDSDGTDEQNLELSRKRAESVKKEFLRVGISTTAKGFGKADQIAPNTPDKKEKNRRVEVYYT